MSQANTTVFVKIGMRVIPVVTLLFIFNFPSAILTYWCTSNIISLLQVFILKQPLVRQYLKIPAVVRYKPEELPSKQKGFVQCM